MIIVLSDEQVDALKNDQLIEAASSIDIKAGEIFGIATEKFIDTWNSINCPYLVRQEDKEIR
jgi:hypothetical protein